ncbi:phosphate ABC transporter substrate-binding protein, partial [bacterium SM23_57]
KQEDLLGIGVYGDPGVLDAVIKDPQGIGFNNLNYAFDFDTGLPVTGARVSPLDTNLNGFLEPEEIYDAKEAAVNAVSLGYYPSPPARDLNLVSKGQPVGLVKIFFTWILTEGQQYLSEMGYVALPQGKLDIELSKLEP